MKETGRTEICLGGVTPVLKLIHVEVSAQSRAKEFCITCFIQRRLIKSEAAFAKASISEANVNATAILGR